MADANGDAPAPRIPPLCPYDPGADEASVAGEMGRGRLPGNTHGPAFDSADRAEGGGADLPPVGLVEPSTLPEWTDVERCIDEVRPCECV